MGSRRPKPGRTNSLRPPEGESWIWLTTTMFGAITFRALGIHARRILDFLLYEHANHGGRENGNLAAPYKQLETWGVTAADVRKGFAELRAAGFVRLTHQGLRQAGGGDPSRYALTWLPTLVGSDQEGRPSHDWAAVLQILGPKGIGTVAAARSWLRREVADLPANRRRTPRRATPHLQVVSPIKCEARKAR